MTLLGLAARTNEARATLRVRGGREAQRRFPRRRGEWWLEPSGAAAILVDGDGRLHEAPGVALAVSGDGWPSSRTGRGDAPPLSSASTPAALARSHAAYVAAAWDARTERLTLIRDPLGQRQLHYRIDDHWLLFSDDLELLLGEPAGDVRLDVAAAVHYLLRGRPPAGMTLAQGVMSLPAAHVLELPLRSGLPSVSRHWTPLWPRRRQGAPKTLRRELASALREAVVARAESGSTAVLLSGGVDSSLVTAMLSPPGAEPVCAFTLACEPEHGMNEDEHARRVAALFRARHRVVRLEAREAADLADRVLERAAPSSAWTAISHEKLLAAVRASGHRRLLTGMGADETFGGYAGFLDGYLRLREHAGRRLRRGHAEWFSELLLDGPSSREILFPGIAEFFRPRGLAGHLARRHSHLAGRSWEIAFHAECVRLAPGVGAIQMMIAHECQHRIPDLLFASFDPIARRHGVAMAHPFLDPELVRLSLALPMEHRYWHEHGSWWAKKMLREVAGEFLPDSVIMRQRMAYDVPISGWMCEPTFGPRLRDRLAQSRVWQSGLFSRRLREKLCGGRPERRGPRPTLAHMEQFWVTLTLAAWYDRYAGGRGASPGG